jgi:hypothetical protein
MKLRSCLCSLFLVAILIGATGAASASEDDMVSLSLNGIETKGVTYTLTEITRNESQLKITVLHQPNEENATLIDFAVYNDSDSQSEEWKAALRFGEHLVGSSCDVKLLLPGGDKELRCEWETGARAGASFITAHVFDISNLANLDDATISVAFTFFENIGQASAANATLIFPLAGHEK